MGDDIFEGTDDSYIKDMHPKENQDENENKSHIDSIRKHLNLDSPPPTKEDIERINEEHSKVMMNILTTIHGNDNEFINVIRSYILTFKSYLNTDEEKLKFINSLIEWSSEPLVCIQNIKKSNDCEIHNIRCRLKELRANKKFIDNAYKNNKSSDK